MSVCTQVYVACSEEKLFRKLRTPVKVEIKLCMMHLFLSVRQGANVMVQNGPLKICGSFGRLLQ